MGLTLDEIYRQDLQEEGGQGVAVRVLLTLDEIYRQDLQALRDRLGRAGMVRFLQQFETGPGDYARERHKWVDCLTRDDLRKLSAAKKPGRKRRKR
jgi:hypothetical protein